MDISKHIALEQLHEAMQLLEKMPASKQQTELSVKLSDLMIMIDCMVDLLEEDGEAGELGVLMDQDS